MGGGISYKYAYNEKGLFKEKWSGNKCLLSYRYDLNGNVISIKDSAGRDAAYTYDAAGKLTDIRDTGSDRTIAVYQYDQAGRVSQVSCGNGMVTSYAYDS